MSMPRQLRNLLAQPGIIRSLAAYDVFTAKIMERVGLPLLFLGGFGTSASSFGLPDLGLLGLAEMTDATRRMTAAVNTPVIVDGDTGYGSVPNVIRTVWAAVREELVRQGCCWKTRSFQRKLDAVILRESKSFPSKKC